MKASGKKIVTIVSVLILGCCILGCLQSADGNDPVVPDIIGKWRTAYPDTVSGEAVDVEKIFQYIDDDSTYMYNKITRGSVKKEIKQDGDWSVLKNKIHMEIDDSYISTNDSMFVVFTPDTFVVERIFSVSNDTLNLTLFYTEINDEGMFVDYPKKTYVYLKQ